MVSARQGDIFARCSECRTCQKVTCFPGNINGSRPNLLAGALSVSCHHVAKWRVIGALCRSQRDSSLMRTAYDKIGTTYSGTRRPDPRIAARILDALGD